jgi:hypothetical protein
MSGPVRGAEPPDPAHQLLTLRGLVKRSTRSGDSTGLFGVEESGPLAMIPLHDALRDR